MNARLEKKPEGRRDIDGLARQCVEIVRSLEAGACQIRHGRA